jgi:hypothetical protein
MPIASLAMALKSMLVFINVHKKIPQAHEYRYSFYPGVFQSIVFIHRETMVKETDNSSSSIY